VASHQVKYLELGVILDAKLSWKQHVEAKCKKALALICLLHRVTGVTWGTTPKTVLWLYTTIIRPYLARSAKLPEGLYILLSVISFFFYI